MTHKNDSVGREVAEEREEAEATFESSDWSAEEKAGDDTTEGEDDESAQDNSTQKPERKERVLHTRVPAVLEQELKRLANALRMPVSNVVRAILEDAVTAVDVVGRKAEGEMNRVVDRLAEKRERLRGIATATMSWTEAPVESAAPKERKAVEGRSAATPQAGGGGKLVDGVIGFQPLVLATRASCLVCGASLKVGTEAFLGVRDVPGPRVLIGRECLPKPEAD